MVQQQMNIGSLGLPGTTFLRKFRWLFSLSYGNNGNGTTVISGNFCRTSSRPNISLEETQLNHVVDVVYLPSRPVWQPIEITIYDVYQEDGTELYNWLIGFYDPADGTMKPAKGAIGTATLKMFDGHGTLRETWNMYGCWPQIINWNDLDYSNSEVADISLTLRYARATRTEN